MNYVGLVKNAFWISWRNRFLWFFGFFAVLGGASSFSAGSPPSNAGRNFEGEEAGDLNSALGFAAQELQRWVSDNLTLIIIVGALLILVFLFLFALGVIASGGLAGSVAAIDRGEARRFSSTFGTGLSSFWRVLGLAVVLFLVWICLFLATGAPLALLFMAVAPTSFVPQTFAVLNALFFTILLVSVLFIPLNIIGQFALRELVVDGDRLFASIRSGYRVFRRNLGRSLLVWLIQVALVIGANIALAIAALVVGLVLALPGIVLLVAGSNTGAIVAFTVAGAIFLPLVLVVTAALATFYHAYWTLAYLRMTAVSSGQESTE